MVKLSMRSHPEVLFSNSSAYVELIMRVENDSGNSLWAEADVSVPENISLAPGSSLRKGRVRVGIIGKKEYLEKSVRVYSTPLAMPQVYRCNVVLYVFNKDGVIDTRLEKPADIQCQMKKDATI